jgi:predicted secreted protein
MFAAEFLMPLAAVNAAAKRLGVQAADVTEADVYQISLRLGVSYAATVVRLETLGLINQQRSSRLRRTSPRPVKRSLLGQTELEDWRSDVWVVNPDGTDRDVHPLVGDRIVLNLPEIPSSGYTWYSETPAGFVVAENELRLPSDDPDHVGVTGDRHLNIRVDEPGDGELSVRLHQPWEGGDVSRQIGVEVSARERPQPGLYGPQRTAVLAS